MKYETELDGLRALAILGVLLFHLGLQAFSGGFSGVDVFFVLSGYLITSIISKENLKGDFSFGRFYIKRARRLLPPLFLVILVTLIFGFLLLSPDHFKALSQSSLFATFSFSNVGFWLESGYFNPDKFTKPLLHTWSLGVEEQFYIIWPLLIYLIFKLKNISAIFLCLISIVLISFFSSVYFTTDHTSAAFFLSPFRVWQFGAGGLFGIWLHAHQGEGRRFLLPPIFSTLSTIGGLTVILYGFNTLPPETFPGYNALIPTIGTLLVILGGLNPISAALLSNPASRFLGKISYSLYLVHWPIIIYWRYYTGAPLNGRETLFVTVLCVVFALCLFWFVERPFRKPWAKTAIREKVIVPLRLFIASSIIILPSAYIWSNNGLTFRMRDSARSIVAQLSDERRARCQSKTKQGNACLIGAKKPTSDFLLLGDSHAGALSLGLDKISKEKGKRGEVHILNGTLPFTDIVTYNRSKPLKRSFNSTYENISKSDSDYVLIHGRFALYWLGVRPEYEHIEPPIFFKLVGNSMHSPPSTIEASQSNFIHGLEQTLSVLSENEKKTVIIGAVPFQGIDMAQCISVPKYLTTEDQLMERCKGFSRQQAMERAQHANKILKDYADKYDAIFIDPTEVFCPENLETCLRLKDDRILYRDRNHLSKDGATLLAEKIFDALGW